MFFFAKPPSYTAPTVQDNQNTPATFSLPSLPTAPLFDIDDADRNGKVNVHGTADAGATVTVTWPDGSTTSTVADDAGRWSLQSPVVQPQGQVAASAVKPGQSDQSAETVHDYIDQTAPRESIPELNDADANGHINASGTAEADALVIVTWPDGSISQTLSDDTGYWSVESGSVQTDGVVRVIVVDGAGNQSDTTQVNYIDTTWPRVPLINHVDDADANGRINLGGVAEIGSTVVATWPDGSMDHIVTDGTGHWSLQSATPQTNGTISVVATDSAGNTSRIATYEYNDDTAPKAPVVGAIHDNDADGRIDVRGTAEAGSTIDVTWPDGSHSTSITGPNGQWSLASHEVQGSGQISFIAIDQAGNRSLSVLGSYTSTLPPATPGLSLLSDSGADAHDHITNIATVKVSGIAGGAAWQYRVDGGTWQTSGGDYFSLREGAHSYEVQQTNVYGTSAVSSPVNYTLDTVAPAMAAAVGVADPDGNFHINAQGGGEAGATVTVTWPDGSTRSALVDGGGHWTMESDTVQGAGNVRAVVTDTAGNVGAVATVVYKGTVLAPNIAQGKGGFSTTGNGFSLSSGDVNGDGFDDIITGSNSSVTPEVVFGGPNGANGGFAIAGGDVASLAGFSVSVARDINGDGLADLIVGAPGHIGSDAGKTYVVYGKTDSATVQLSDVAAGKGGYVINGEDGNSGYAISAAGDVNGDGLSDMIVGAFNADGGAGKSYVVFAKNGNAPIELSSVAAGVGGFAIGKGGASQSGFSVADVGDVNGDGLTDLLVGSFLNTRSYVVFGKADGAGVDFAAVDRGVGGFALQGAGFSGYTVSGAGDVNGDGLADLIVAADLGTNVSSYVVFGKANGATVDLATLGNGANGYAVGNGGFGYYSVAASGAGDINGDGLADLIIGVDGMGAYAGKSYVAYGKSDAAAVDLAQLANGVGGFAIDNAGGAAVGYAVAAGGDINGDGLADLVVGSNNSGAYVIYGGTQFATRVDRLGTSGNDMLAGTTAANVIVGGLGDDILIGNGGNDVLYAGAGNDAIHLNGDNVAGLSAGVVGGQLARIDGGGGIDTLMLDGAGVTLDLTKIANQGDGGSRIESIERIDLGTGNTLTLGLRDVLDMAESNSFNSGNGWNGLAGAEGRHQLVLDGTTGDVVKLSQASGAWADTHATVNNGGHTYEVWITGGANGAQLLIDQLLTVNANI